MKNPIRTENNFFKKKVVNFFLLTTFFLFFLFNKFALVVYNYVARSVFYSNG